MAEYPFAEDEYRVRTNLEDLYVARREQKRDELEALLRNEYGYPKAIDKIMAIFD